mmetsp:Transcript_31280/g.74320  ORF Transcript_31280/g.74320 Transcript_31280/m.74320 type:complete len:215 (-) Transcript_31280:2542-3186(-)
MHCDLLAAPCREEESAGHSKVLLLPRQYESAGHNVHAPPSSPVYPATQEQSVCASLVDRENPCVGHVLATPAEHHLPAGHLAHGPPPGPKNPPTQMQSVRSSLPGTAEALTGHVRHTDPTTAARTVPYLPSEHSVQLLLPVAPLWDPFGHAGHGPPSAPEWPALQMHEACDGDLAGEFDPDGQAPHERFVPAPRAAEKVPAMQSTHTPTPCPSL